MQNCGEAVVVSVVPLGPFDASFSYLCGSAVVAPGDVVEVPFGNRRLLGVVTADQPVEIGIKLKTIAAVFPHNIGLTSLKFLQWMSDYTLIPRGNVLKMMLAEKSVFRPKKNDSALGPGEEIFQFQDMMLNEDQRAATEGISKNGNRPFLLHGVTGSGKTEVYLAAAREILQSRRQILILFPEIALTDQIVNRIHQYFGLVPAIWNSQVSSKNKRIVWHGAISGEIHVFVGARSALFLPFKNLGMIIVDEEHDSSYKQEDGCFYNARDMAIVRGHFGNIPVILSSATPSLESYLNAKNGKYGYVFMKNRFGKSVMPSIKLIDMRQNKFDGFISPPLLRAIEDTLARGEQSLIYLNRRGYSPITLCRACGEKMECPNCTSWLVYHKSADKIICHHCGHRRPVPQKCPFCAQEDSMIPFGPGVERISDELKSKLPDARIEVGSSDTIASGKNMFELFDRMRRNEIDIIIGTQILAKGHHFPNITLVGIVDGDLGLHGADIRAPERTYQLISQVSGRAGRAEKEGKILIQTFNPSHSLYVALQSPDPGNFMDLELLARQKADLPPFSKFAALIISGTNHPLTENVARDLARVKLEGVRLFGPAPAPFFLLKGRSRWRILLKAPKKIAVNNLIRSWIYTKKYPKNVKIQIDIDPTSFL
ncbi:MAG: primosomal protein N' [Holosporaceae bacterium]|jgi:primosomal protein N' (replication factor Y)|nr:primosomal protein N' [Holosporaceae bacterium]